MSIKVKQAIERCLFKIKDKTFDEETILTLLISIREYIKLNSLIKELAHFIAHPSRNRGIFHSKVNSRYTKFRLYENQILELLDMDIEKFNQSEEQLNKFLLGGVNVNRIEAKLFKILYEDGIDDIPEDFIKKNLGFSRVEIKKIMKDHYVKHEDEYFLKVMKTERMIFELKKFELSQIEIDSIAKAEKLISRVRTQIDEIQKIIRGSIYFTSVFEIDALSNEFHTIFVDVLEHFQIDKFFMEFISLNMNDILLCLMVLLHDSKMIFYDKAEGRISLCVYMEENDKLISGYNRSKDILYTNGLLALKIECETQPSKKFVFPVFISDLKICNYITYVEFENSNVSESFDELPWISAIREKGKIRLIGVNDN